MNRIRQNHEPPLAISEWGWRYHHIGIPTNKVFKDENYLAKYKFYVSGFNTSPFGVEWMRFEPGSPVSELIQKVPHIAFEVDDLDSELSRDNFNILSFPDSPGKGTRTAMIVHNGAPIELIEFKKNKKGL
jgi:hypothetical protein